MKYIQKILAFFDPKETESRSRKIFLWSMNALAIPIWSAALTCMSLFLGTSKYKWALFGTFFDKPLIFALNMLPVLLLVTALLLMSNRFWGAVLGSAVIVVVPSAINYFKLFFRDEPLLASDWILYSEALDMGQKYSVSLTFAIKIAILMTVLSAILAFFVLRAKLPKARFFGLIPLVLIGVLLYPRLYDNEGIYESTENILAGSAMSYWSFTDQYISRGSVYPFIVSTTYDDGKPEDYDPAAAREMLERYAYDDIPSDKKVSVIAIMLESYNDLSKFGIFEFTENPYSFMHELYEESWHGELVVDIFAGDTIKSELSFLTGNTMHFTYSMDADSYVRYFSEQGYFAEYSHPCYDWFYNRKNVCEYIGFDNAWFYENRYNYDGYIIDDSQLFPDIIGLYEETAATGTPYFHYSVTYQNHGPYPDTEIVDREYITTDGLSEAAGIILNNYFDGMRRTDDALREFYGYFRDEEEPVIILIFGDHNPWLGHASFVYDELDANFGLSFNVDSETGFYNFYSTPYVIWANDSAKAALGREFTGQGENFSPAFLMSELFEQAGWEGDEFMKASGEFRGDIDIVHVNGIIREDGVLKYHISEDALAKIERMNAIQYYRYHDMLRAGLDAPAR